MIVHFIAPSIGFEKKQDVIKSIESAVTDRGHVMTQGAWTNAATMLEMGLGLLDQEEWELLCKREMEQLNAASIVIVEVSNKATFGTGYMAAHALMAKKPTLFLLQENSIGGSFTTGLKHEALTRGIYNSRNLNSIIQEFLEAKAS